MDSLTGYGSDDDCEDSQEEKKQDWRSGTASERVPSLPSARHQPSGPAQVDANYEEVQMDLSGEESNGSDDKQARSSRRDRDDYRGRYDRDKDSRESPKHKDDYRSKRYRDEDEKYRKDDRSGHSREDRSKYYEKERDRDKDRDRDKHRDDRRRDRQRSRSPRRSDYRRRSRSRERDNKTTYSSKRYDRASNKMAQLDKLGIEIKTPDCQYVTPSELQRSMDDQKRNNRKEPAEKDRFYMPGITGRFKDQIEKRKLLWQKKEPEKEKPAATREPVVEASGSRTGKLWEATTFAQDSDGKVANKFKRLMGIRGTADGGKSTDVLKKQEEMFSSMEQQYEVARTATHTMRGVGLGFGSFQR